MANKSIYLDEECMEILKGYKQADPNFKLSNYIQDKIKEDKEMLTPAQIDQKVKMAQIAIEDNKLKIETYKRIRPLAEARMDALKDTLQPKSIAIGILKRLISEGKEDFELVKIAKVHETMNGVDYKELIKEAKNGK